MPVSVAVMGYIAMVAFVAMVGSVAMVAFVAMVGSVAMVAFVAIVGSVATVAFVAMVGSVAMVSLDDTPNFDVISKLHRAVLHFHTEFPCHWILFRRNAAAH